MVIGLCVQEVVRVYDGEEVEVVFVDKVFDFVVGVVVGEQIIGKVFDDYGVNLFVGVYCVVDDDGWFDVFVGVVLEMDICNGVVLE